MYIRKCISHSTNLFCLLFFSSFSLLPVVIILLAHTLSTCSLFPLLLLHLLLLSASFFFLRRAARFRPRKSLIPRVPWFSWRRGGRTWTTVDSRNGETGGKKTNTGDEYAGRVRCEVTRNETQSIYSPLSSGSRRLSSAFTKNSPPPLQAGAPRPKIQILRLFPSSSSFFNNKILRFEKKKKKHFDYF